MQRNSTLTPKGADPERRSGGIVFGTLGTAKFAGKFAGASFKGDVTGRSCGWEITLERAH